MKITDKTNPFDVYLTLKQEGVDAETYFLMKNKISKMGKKRRVKKDSVTYISPSGNKFIVFAWPQGLQAVVIRETAVSLHLYVPFHCFMDNDEHRLGYVHFTPHFFLRLLERNDLEEDRKCLIKRVVDELHNSYYESTSPRKGFEDYELFVSTSLGTFLGHHRNEGGLYIQEITTCIPINMTYGARQKRYMDNFNINQKNKESC